MHLMVKRWAVRFVPLLAIALLLSGCAAGRGAYVQGEKAFQQQSYDAAVASFLAAVDKEPDNQQYRLQLKLARSKSSLVHKAWGDQFLEQKNYTKALEEYQLALELDGSLFTAADGVAQTRQYLQAQRLVEDAEGLLKARRKIQARDAVEKALAAAPDFQPALRLQEKIKNQQSTIIDGVELEVNSNQLINLNFREAQLQDVFEIITKLSGINFILDEDVRGSNTTLFLERATFAQALELLLRMNKLDKKILNSKTIILFPQTRDKQKQFEDQIIQTFFLSNVDAKKAVNLLRTMLQVRKIYVHEELNAIIIRDTPQVIKLAQKIIELNDRANSEVVFDLELIEVNHTDDRELGLKLSNYSVSAGLSPDGIAQIAGATISPGLSTDGLIGSGVNGNPFAEVSPFYAIPTATFRLMKTQVDAEVLASPKIRVKNKEKAKVHVGSREPTITVTINGDQTSENVQYVDVGVKLNVEPSIQLDGTVVTKLGLEVSNVSGRETTSNGTAVLTISTTNADTVLTLKDGEQTIIGGLIRDDKSVTKNKIPLLGDIPLLGELFTGTDKFDGKREILLSITPHIVKSVNLPQGDDASIWSGGEDDLKDGRNFGTFAADYSAGQAGLTPPRESQAEAAEATPQEPQATPAEEAEEAAEDEPASSLEPETAAEEVSASLQPEPVEVVGLPPTEQVALAVQPRVYAQSPQLVKLQDEFSVTFFVSEIENLFSAPLYVRYDQQLFEFLGATEGNFLKQGTSPTIFTHTALDGSGRIIVGLKQGAGGKGLSGGGDLFSMQFKAIAAGRGEIAPTRTNFRNPRGERLKVDDSGVQIEVGQ